MVTLLLLTCGTNACYHITKILKEKFYDDFRIIGTDINKQWLLPSAHYLDAFYQCPPSSNENYYNFILDICKREKVNFILPSFDYDHFLFYDGNLDLINIGTKSLGIHQSIKSLYSNKKETFDYLSSIGISTPILYDISDIQKNNLYFVKPISGVGSIGAKIEKGENILNNKNDDIVIQEICSEPEVTLECFYFKNKLYSVARTRLATKSGVCTKAKVYQDSKLHAIAETFAKKTHVPYVFNLQFMLNANETPVVTDVNLRTAGGMSLSYAAGWDEVSSLANIMLNKDDNEITSTISSPIQDQFIVRVYEDIVTKKIKCNIGIDFDGTILDSKKRHSLLMAKILNEQGIDINTEDLVQFKSNKHNNIEWLLSKGVDFKHAVLINSLWMKEIESSQYLSYDTLYPNAENMLSALAQEYDLYLITARNNKENLLNQINNLNIQKYFSEIIVVGSNATTAQQKSNILKDRNIHIYIGDTESDLEASKISNCYFIASTYGFRSSSFWDNKHSIHVNNISELKEKIAKGLLKTEIAKKGGGKSLITKSLSSVILKWRAA